MRDNTKLRSSVLEALWKNPLLGLAAFDPDNGTLRDANDAFFELLDSRFRTKKTLGTAVHQCLPDFEVSGLQEAFRRTLTTGLPVHADAVRLHRGNTTVMLNCMVLPVAGEGMGPGEGVPQALLLVASERKTELPSGDAVNLIDMHTRHALARQFHLSAREIDIVSECLQGKKNRQIAQDLHIGISTVKRHLESAYRKIGISSSRSLPVAILKVARSVAGGASEVSVAAAPSTGIAAA